MAHRVAWALHYNKWPQHTIDHINRDGTDNRLENIRDVPQCVNNSNKSKTYKKMLTTTDESSKQNTAQQQKGYDNGSCTSNE
jgi:hypothetical protein